MNYEKCLRLLSTTAVLQGNKWSINDYASEYNVRNYNKLKVRNIQDDNKQCSFLHLTLLQIKLAFIDGRFI